MGKAAKIVLGVAVAVTALGAGIYLQLTRHATDASTEGVAVLTRTALPDLSGKRLTLAAWKGKVLVVNFWATWCAPCRKEIPGLISVQRENAANGAQVVGIAVDQADNVQAFAKELGINYPVLIAGMDGVDLVRKVGNPTGALPFTIVLDRSGKVVMTHLGLVSEQELRKLLVPLVADAAKSG